MLFPKLRPPTQTLNILNKSQPVMNDTGIWKGISFEQGQNHLFSQFIIRVSGARITMTSSTRSVSYRRIVVSSSSTRPSRFEHFPPHFLTGPRNGRKNRTQCPQSLCSLVSRIEESTSLKVCTAVFTTHPALCYLFSQVCWSDHSARAVSSLLVQLISTRAGPEATKDDAVTGNVNLIPGYGEVRVVLWKYGYAVKKVTLHQIRKC